MPTLAAVQLVEITTDHIQAFFENPDSDMTFMAVTNGGSHYLVNIRPGKFMRINTSGEMFVHRRADVLINGILQAPGRTTVSYGTRTRTLVVRNTETNTVIRSSSTIQQAHRLR